MASSIIGIVTKLRSLTANRALASLRRSLSTKSSERIARPTRRAELFVKIIPLGHPSLSMVPVLEQWVKEGNEISARKLRNIVNMLRNHRRYSHALEVFEWMSDKRLRPLSSSDHAICVDLIGKVRGMEAAESHFNNLDDLKENARVYDALLSCYVRESLVEKSLSLLQKMKDLGFANAFSYNTIMSLYKSTEQLDKIPKMLMEMKKDGIAPNNVTYRLCINAYGQISDVSSMQKVLKEMEAQPNIVLEWGTYSVVASFYVKAGDHEKSLIYLNICEELVGQDALGYGFLITQHASLGHKDEIMRLWGLMKANCKKRTNKDYKNMLHSVVKLGAFEEGEEILKEWESSCSVFDFRVPEVLLIGYCQKGMTKKAESTLCKLAEKGKTPTSYSWAIVAEGHLDEKSMEKAFECLKKAIAVPKENAEWRPKTRLIMEILNWLVDSADVEEVEAYIILVKNMVSADKEMYRALIRSYVKAGKEVGGVLVSMKSEGVELDEETEKNLNTKDES